MDLLQNTLITKFICMGVDTLRRMFFWCLFQYTHWCISIFKIIYHVVKEHTNKKNLVLCVKKVFIMIFTMLQAANHALRALITAILEHLIYPSVFLARKVPSLILLEQLNANIALQCKSAQLGVLHLYLSSNMIILNKYSLMYSKIKQKKYKTSQLWLR